MRPCVRCGVDDRYPSGACRPCRKRSNKAYAEGHRAEAVGRTQRWQRRNPDKVRDAYLRKTYGITVEDEKHLLESQGGVCAICEAEDTGPMRFHIDHDHATGQVRGVLCGNCNKGIGLLRDDPALLERATIYLSEGPEALRKRVGL